jgi:hypothetical protein
MLVPRILYPQLLRALVCDPLPSLMLSRKAIDYTFF